MPTYCGVDIGTSNLKVVLLDAAGGVIGRVCEPTPRRSDGIGPCSDAAEIVERVEQLIIAAAADAGLRSPLSSISVAGIGEDGVLVDARGGAPRGLAIPWFDERADAEAHELRDLAAPYAYRTGIAIDGARTAAKWLWLARQRVAIIAERGTWIALTDYPAFAWTGTAFMSETLAARTGCYDCIERKWVPQLLAAAQAPQLPKIAVAGQVVGGVRSESLRRAGVADERTVVVAGGHDHPMAASVILGIDARAVIDSMGTAELIYAESEHIMGAGLPAAGSPYLARSIRVGGESGSAGLGVFELSAALQRLMNDVTARASAMRAVLDGAQIPGAPGAGGLRFNPLDGCLDASRAAGAEAARAVFEGCAMYTRRVLDAVADAGFSIGPIYTTGGWTHSSSFLRLRADVFGQPLHLVDEPQLTAFGAAVYGARAAGADGAVLRQNLAQRVVVHNPRLSDFYADLYLLYRAQFDRTKPERELNPSPAGPRKIVEESV